MAYSTRELSRLLRRLGYEEDRKRGKGSHVRFYLEHDGKIIRVTTVPRASDEITPGTLGAILRQVGISQEELQAIRARRFTEKDYLRKLGLG